MKGIANVDYVHKYKRSQYNWELSDFTPELDQTRFYKFPQIISKGNQSVWIKTTLHAASEKQVHALNCYEQNKQTITNK